MNINKYLKKLDIEFTYDSKSKIFTFIFDGIEKQLSKKEIEQHLFWSFVNLIKEKK